jgi:hypothetical protein
MRATASVSKDGFTLGVGHQDDGNVTKESSADENDFFVQKEFPLTDKFTASVGATYYDLSTLGNTEGDFADINIGASYTDGEVQALAKLQMMLPNDNNGRGLRSRVSLGKSFNWINASLGLMHDTGAFGAESKVIGSARLEFKKILGIQLWAEYNLKLIGERKIPDQTTFGGSMNF